MKTTFVRAAVMTLAFVGLAVPSMTSAKTATKSVTATTAWSGYPMPLCPPNGSQGYCGMQ